MKRAGIIALLSLGCCLHGQLLAKSHPEPAPGDGLMCQQLNGGVLLEWNFQFFAPILGYVVGRDGQDLTKLPPDATSYFDGAVPAGAHVYTLRAINFTGEILDLARCEVVVVDFGLRCKVDGNKVDLEWGPILIDVLILNFRISRDGDTIATVPADQINYTDQVFTLGEHRYAVHAVTSPDSEFLVGTCSAQVTCFGLRTEVSGLKVALAWDPFPSASPLPVVYVISRDNELVAKTEATDYVDEVPAPGRYLYQVFATFGRTDPAANDVPDFLIGACIVGVPGETIPPPQNLVCAVVRPEPGPVPVDPLPLDPDDPTNVDSDGDGVIDGPIPVVSVLLRWENPIRYDKILIARNKAIAATLDGSATSFIDHIRGGGEFVYSVYGIVGDQKSDPAECNVVVPPLIVLPPQDFTCRVLDIVLDPTDPDNTGPVAPGDDGVVSPVPIVLLSWWNPVKYARLVIIRDGTPLARIPGDSMLFRDVDPGAGKHVYGIYGVIEDGRQSPTVECEVEVGGEPVPPVFDLQCMVTQPSNTIPSGSVILVWENAAAYDRILILRNGELIFEDTGELRKYHDLGLDPGVYVYCVVAVKNERRSPPTCCQVVISGPPTRNLLYFTPSLAEPVPVDLSTDPPVPEPIPPFPGNRTTCLIDNVRPLQGWSFGVGSDPEFIVPRSVDLGGTATEAFNGGQGPAFLHVDILDSGAGVVMAVVVDAGLGASDPPETLPPGRGHRILNIEYDAGPKGQAGQAYPVRYTSTLGDPPVQVIFVVGGFEVVPSTQPGWISLPGPFFLRGDANSDGGVDLSDAMFTLSWLFLGGRTPSCLEAANANGSRQVNIADPIYALSFLFGGGPPPPFPFPFCGFGPAPLGCLEPGPCPLPEPVPADQ